MQNQIFKEIKDLSDRVSFTGGAGVIMDVKTGEILALTSYPEYNSQTMTDGSDSAAINKYLTNKNNPFLNRIVDGLYTPGSTVKPYMAYAAQSEKVIDPLTVILGTASISLPSPYDPAHPSVFKDWRAQGPEDMRHALAVSSDVYFYEIGGGYQGQPGLGIDNIDKYMKLFGFSSIVPFSNSFFFGPAGTIPTPAWKLANFNNEKWNIGDTYHTSIGQYGFQVTPLQLVRAISAIANGGKLLTPQIVLDPNRSPSFTDLNLDQNYLQVIHEGMHDGVTKDYGVSHGLDSPDYTVASKTGTAELGVYKQFVNSWVTGFFPYDNPKYAFTIIMEKGPVTNTTGALSIMRQTLDWMVQNKPQYLK